MCAEPTQQVCVAESLAFTISRLVRGCAAIAGKGRQFPAAVPFRLPMPPLLETTLVAAGRQMVQQQLLCRGWGNGHSHSKRHLFPHIPDLEKWVQPASFYRLLICYVHPNTSLAPYLFPYYGMCSLGNSHLGQTNSVPATTMINLECVKGRILTLPPDLRTCSTGSAPNQKQDTHVRAWDRCCMCQSCSSISAITAGIWLHLPARREIAFLRKVYTLVLFLKET